MNKKWLFCADILKLFLHVIFLILFVLSLMPILYLWSMFDMHGAGGFSLRLSDFLDAKEQELDREVNRLHKLEKELQ